VLKRLINKLKKAYPGALILFRADAGFAVPALYLEEQPQTRYVIGFIANNRLLAKAAPLLEKAQRQYQETGEKQRLFSSFSYRPAASSPLNTSRLIRPWKNYFIGPPAA